MLLFSFWLFSGIQSCTKNALEPEGFSLKITDYNIFQGNLADLIPNEDYNLYELASPFFSDYAEKQRLIKVPAGTLMSAEDNELLNFPNGTIIVKTFYYFKDKRNEMLGKTIVETRLLIKENEVWKTGVYLWNDTQTDANLISAGFNKSVNWIDATGNAKAAAYHIPSNAECATCHLSDGNITPIGTKSHHLNIDVIRNNISQNQLTFLQNEGVLNIANANGFETTPNYNDVNLSLEARGRAYLDINCAACHSEKGIASDEKYRFDYAETLENSKILEAKTEIINQMEIGEMPQSGAALVHTEGLELIKAFIENL